MAQIIREIRVDVSQPNVFQAIVAKQLDCNSRFLKITLVDFGVKIEVPETAKVTINANRPDGKSQSFVGVANNDGTITVPLAQWMLEVAGELKCDVSVINTTDNKRLTSTDFFVNVQEAANKSTDISENPDGEIRVITPTQKIDENSSDDEYPSAKAVYGLDNITATATGSSITIDSAKAPLQNLKLFGKTTQNGTPTPDAPIDLVSVGDSGSFDVGVYGKNLLEITTTTQTINGVTFTVNADKSITASGTASATTQFRFVDVPFIPKGEYIISGYPQKVSGIEYYFRATGEGWTQRVGEVSVTYTEDTSAYGMIVIGANITVNKLTFYPMLRKAEITDSTYEPCNKQSITTPYTLPSVKEYKDEIDFARGVRTQKVIRATDFKLIATYTNTDVYVCNTGLSLIGGSNNMAICNVMTNYVYNTEDNVHFYVHTSGTINVYVPKGYDIASKPIVVIAVLQTPEETPLTETELNAYRQLCTNKGTTTILSECEDTEITYYINKPNAQAIGSLHEQINKDYIKLQQAIISTGGSTL